MPRDRSEHPSVAAVRTTAETTGVTALLDEVQRAVTEAERDRSPGLPAEFDFVPGARRVAVAYVLGRRNMPLSDAPRVRHLLELRERGHAV